MSTKIDLANLGAALKRRREARGLTQEKLAELFSGDERTVRRYENGERRPGRNTIIKIMVQGFGETLAEKVNETLELSGYGVLTENEVASQGLTPAPEPKARFSVLLSSPPEQDVVPDEILRERQVLALFGMPIVLITIATVGLNAFRVAPTWFVVVTSGLYASLYAVSILLETSYRPTRLRIYWAAMFIFGFVFMSSTLALAFDAYAIGRQSTSSLWWTLLTFFGSGAVQWFWLRSVLPVESIVPAKFQTMTAQAAHLKNTAYFLLAVVLFWVVPFHSIASLGHLAHTQETQTVRQILASSEPLIGQSFVFIKPLWLFILTLVLIGFSIPMGAHLLDGLEAKQGHNRYLALFYGRAILYFVLCFLCLLWYSVSVSQLSSALSRTSAARPSQRFFEAGN